MRPKFRNESFLLGCALLVLINGTAFAVPALQLDILGGAYDWSTETIVAQSDPFTLYAYLKPTLGAPLSDIYYISAALVPKTGPAPLTNGGSFVFNGTTVDVTQDMVYGIPPLEANLSASKDPGDLAKHGIFLTYFQEFSFTFNPGNLATLYNTQEQPGIGPTDNPSGSMYYMPFLVDTTGLAPGFAIHFDLYNEYARRGGDIDIDKFAPFSHDAQSGNPVPEPGTMVLLGTGLVGLAGWGRKKFRK